MKCLRACRNKTDIFCYICRECTIVPNKNPVTKFIKCAYHTYFGIKLDDQDISLGDIHGMQDMYRVSKLFDQWQEALSEVWNSHRVEGAWKTMSLTATSTLLI